MAPRDRTRTLFDLEHQMLEPVLYWLNFRGYRIKREYRTPWGICDIVGILFDADHVARRLALRQTKAIGHLSRIAVLQATPEKDEGDGISLSELRTKLGPWFTPQQLSKDVNELQRRKLIVARNGCYVRLNGWAPLHRSIVAIELKMDRVDEAFHQAERHALFATETYVALPHNLATKVMEGKRQDHFRQRGVGLLTVTNEQCTVLLRSQLPASLSDPVFQMHCAERFWKEAKDTAS